LLCKHEGGLRKERNKDLVYPRERLQVLERDNHTCRKCDKMFDPVMLRVDHKVRPQDGGSGQMQNLQTLCIACHFQKHSELRESMKVLQSPMTVTLTIQLQPQIYEELKSAAAECDNATYSQIIENLLHIRKYYYGRKGKDTTQVELWRGKKGLFSIFRSNDRGKKSEICVQLFSRRINRMTPKGFHEFMRTHDLSFVGKFDF
jgi:HNH endonuclease